MNAEIIAVGTELLLGQIANTNAQFISQECAEIGINVFYHTVVGDNPERLKNTIKTAESRSDCLIFTGGLGPTKDDLTKETLAQSLGRSLVMDEDALEKIEAYFKKTGRTMTENNRRQAIVLEGAQVLPNNHGMAPGMILEGESTRYILMPGPPSEMKPMFMESVKPYLLSLQGERIHSRVLRFFGIGESQLETELMDLIDGQTNPTIAPYAKEGEVTLRLSARTNDTEKANEMLDEIEAKILERVGSFLYGYGEENSHAAVVFDLLKRKGLTVAMAESLTGGAFSQTLTDFAGASEIVKGGIVCYTNEVKENVLGVPKEVLETDGAVSATCAKEMAERIRLLTEADMGISFTGVAGPSESEGKPVGTVFIGLSMADKETKILSLQLSGSRTAIRNRTVKQGLELIRKSLQ
ncbi:competence/damage-inducible protein A [Pullulanibacillus sp. KACC 23026]|uniref:competence/damage-inducible protein A n=1 Tax=Pullulanibacillus sp. KACC 23026 TaxID=3028315 RepID=UPI0023AF1576|nr:competence/damage-inducible protein A [Pullulanibacillus sp. KACC 23026]WEG11553.1 competence/damage-inducible protein A [Pullulanibacillus sp. KACC 23026]